MLNDTVRAAIIAFVQSLFPVLNLTGVVSLSSDDISILMLAITNALTLLFLVVKSGQQAA